MAPPQLLKYLLDPVHFWMILGSYEDEPIVFDRWQIADMHDYSRLRFREKAPQIGASWIRAAEAVWEAILFEDATTAFVSMDQREASEKVLYARKLYDGLPEVVKKWVPIVKDSFEEIGFGEYTRPSRVMSIPNSSALRGRRMSVVLDECDFYKDGGLSAYRAAVGRIARGGRVTANSTCWGTGTLLDQMMQGIDETGAKSDESSVVSKARFPYTVIENPELMESVELARGTLDPADFGEEYECIRGLVGGSPFPADLLRSRLHEDGEWETNDNKIVGIPDDRNLVAGYDVGKGSGRHPSVLSLFRNFPDGTWKQVLLYSPHTKGGKPMNLPEQQEWLTMLMIAFPNLRIVPDAQGVGAQVTQSLEKKFGSRRVVPMIPNSKPAGRKPQDREELVTECKRQLEAGELWILPEIEQMKQFSRTRRDEQGRIVQRGSSKRDHYDRFWATVYASYGIAERRGVSPYARHGLIVIGGERGVA